MSSENTASRLLGQQNHGSEDFNAEDILSMSATELKDNLSSDYEFPLDKSDVRNVARDFNRSDTSERFEQGSGVAEAFSRVLGGDVMAHLHESSWCDQKDVGYAEFVGGELEGLETRAICNPQYEEATVVIGSPSNTHAETVTEGEKYTGHLVVPEYNEESLFTYRASVNSDVIGDSEVVHTAYSPERDLSDLGEDWEDKGLFYQKRSRL